MQSYVCYTSITLLIRKGLKMKKLLTVFILFLLIILSLSAISSAENYYVKNGDTLWDISRKTGVPVKIIINQNNIYNPTNIYIGQKLIIQISFNENQNKSTLSNYTVKSGDTLWKLAEMYNTSAEKIIGLNNIKAPYYLYIGQKLRLPVNNSSSPVENKNYIYYTIKAGDILWNIANKYQTTVQNLVKLNNIKDSFDLYVGRKLIVPLNDNDKYLPTPETRPEKDYNSDYNYNNLYAYYRIKENDKLTDIARKYGVNVTGLMRYNSISNIDNIIEGELLIIPLKISSKYFYLKRTASKLNNYYRVSSGDTISQIARYYMIPEEAIRSLNNLTSNEDIYTGQKLLMPVSPALFVKHKVYRVKNNGEYLHDIAYNNGISIKSILKANYLKDLNARLNPGEIIIVPLDEKSKVTWIEYENGKPVNSIFS